MLREIVREAVRSYLSSLSEEELPEIMELVIRGFETCSADQKERLRKVFLGDELWGKLNQKPQ